MGIGYVCRWCRPKSNKLAVVEPDADVIPVSRMRLLKPMNSKIAAGGWERIARRAALCVEGEVVRVSTGKNYLSHYATYHGLLSAGRRLKLNITIQHGKNELYLKAKPAK